VTIAYAQHFSTRQTPQTEAVPGKPMVENSAGGFGFTVDDWTRLQRFLVLGSEGGSYYATERKLTIENAQCVVRCLDADPDRTVNTIVQISDSGRAPKNDPAIFALAIAAGHKDPKARAAAMAALPRVCRIGTHIFQFAEAVQAFRGWGKGLRKGIAAWYLDKTPEQLAYQVGKYQSRGGWSHRDLVRLAHPQVAAKLGDDGDLVAVERRQATLRWAVGGKDALGAREIKRSKDGPAEPQADVASDLPRFLVAVDGAKGADQSAIVRLIRDDKLPRECIPTEHLNAPEVWEALLAEMPLTAMIRNLGKMTAVGLLKPMSDAAKSVADRLADQDYIRKSRLHPMAVLLAARTYATGHGDKGKLSWTPVSQINDALDAAFYRAFGNIDPANKRTLLALDVSGSMGSLIGGTGLSCREAAAAFAMATARTEPRHQIMAFSSQFMPLDVSAGMSLRDVVAKTSNLPFMGTDCAIPMMWAAQNDVAVDTFIVLTDSETWFGSTHPYQALVQYRERMGIPAKLIVAAFTSSGFSIADPSDAGMLDCVGLDSSLPNIMSDFSRG
jgi:60 kDa SS-A/Ro ribonucleoprotein